MQFHFPSRGNPVLQHAVLHVMSTVTSDNTPHISGVIRLLEA